MTRRATWEADLAAYITETRDLAFEWGAHDCILWATGAAKAMTGTDPAADFRGAYGSQAEAREKLREIGSGTLLKTMQARLEEKPKSMAIRGDIIWNGQAAGICMGAYALFVTEGGLGRVPRSAWKRAFAV